MIGQDIGSGWCRSPKVVPVVGPRGVLRAREETHAHDAIVRDAVDRSLTRKGTFPVLRIAVVQSAYRVALTRECEQSWSRQGGRRCGRRRGRCDRRGHRCRWRGRVRGRRRVGRGRNRCRRRRRVRGDGCRPVRGRGRRLRVRRRGRGWILGRSRVRIAGRGRGRVTGWSLRRALNRRRVARGIGSVARRRRGRLRRVRAVATRTRHQ